MMQQLEAVRYVGWPMVCDSCRWTTVVAEVGEVKNGQVKRVCDLCRFGDNDDV